MAPQTQHHHQQEQDNTTVEIYGKTIEVPNAFLCPITLQIMVHPVLSRSGINYERSAILGWLQNGATTCPMTREPMGLSDLVSNKNLKNKIATWRQENGIAIDEQDNDNDMQAQRSLGYGFVPVPGKQMDEIVGTHVIRQMTINERMPIISILGTESSRREQPTSTPTRRPGGLMRLNFQALYEADADMRFEQSDEPSTGILSSGN